MKLTLNKLVVSIMSIIFLMIVFLIISPTLISAPQTPVSLAVLPFENMNGNPNQDYLKGIISYILIEDLSGFDALMIVERAILETVIKE